MGVVEEDVQRMRREVAEAVAREALQAGSQKIASARGVGGEAVGLPLVTPGERGSGDGQDQLQRPQEDGDEDHAGVRGGSIDAEGREEAGLVHQTARTNARKMPISTIDSTVPSRTCRFL